MDGIVPLWKEKGMTSFDCVFQVRRLLQTKKVGHSGTLDPEVDGVLPICVGKATKMVDYLHEVPKTYVGAITLGIATETEDAHGEPVETKQVEEPVSTVVIDEQMAQMVGNIIQVPPMYSAVKVNGKRLYEYARAGQSVERPSRPVTIYSFERTSEPVYDEQYQTQTWTFRVTCSKGTYVRTLAVDLGRQLGYPAHMSALTRIQSGAFTQEDCVTLAELRAAVESHTVQSLMKPLDWAVHHYPAVTIDADRYQRVKNGALIEQSDWPAITTLTRVYYEDQLVALYDVHPTKPGLLKPVKMF